MNGAPLTPDHGFPARAFVPGVPGARSVKWVQSVALKKGPSEQPWNQYYYKDAAAVEIQSLPLQSLILSANATSTTATLKGVAYGGGSGLAVKRVEVSSDDGATWRDATLLKEAAPDDSAGAYGWVRWSLDAPLAGSATFVCRATDAVGTTQPEVAPKNRGYIFNGWSKKTVVAAGV